MGRARAICSPPLETSRSRASSQNSTNRRTMPALRRDNVQGLIVASYQTPCSRHLLFEVTDAEGARSFLRDLIPRITRASQDLSERPEPLINVGLSYGGLDKLVAERRQLDGFPTPFKAPPNTEVMGDVGTSAMENWWNRHFRNDQIHLDVILHCWSGTVLDSATADNPFGRRSFGIEGASSRTRQLSPHRAIQQGQSARTSFRLSRRLFAAEGELGRRGGAARPARPAPFPSRRTDEGCFFASPRTALGRSGDGRQLWRPALDISGCRRLRAVPDRGRPEDRPESSPGRGPRASGGEDDGTLAGRDSPGALARRHGSPSRQRTLRLQGRSRRAEMSADRSYPDRQPPRRPLDRRERRHVQGLDAADLAPRPRLRPETGGGPG